MNPSLPGVPEAVDPSDVELLGAVRNGDANAFATLYDRHYDAALKLARRNARQNTDAQDITADAFAATYGAIMRGSGPTEDFGPYLRTAVRNAAARTSQKSARQVPTEDDHVLDEATPGADEPTFAAVESAELTDMLATLPPRWQAVLWRTEVEGLTPREIADEWGMKPNSVSALAVRARSGLRLAYLSAQLRTPSKSLPQACQATQVDLPALVRESLPKTRVRPVLEHVAECDECTRALAELESVNSRLGAIATPLLLLEVARARFSNFWHGSTTAKAVTVGGGAAVAAVAVYASSVVGGDDEAPAVEMVTTDDGMVTITDVSTGDQPRRTFEVTVDADVDGPAQLTIDLGESVEFMGTYSPSTICMNDGSALICDLTLTAGQETTWRFAANAQSVPAPLPTVSLTTP